MLRKSKSQNSPLDEFSQVLPRPPDNEELLQYLLKGQETRWFLFLSVVTSFWAATFLLFFSLLTPAFLILAPFAFLGYIATIVAGVSSLNHRRISASSHMEFITSWQPRGESYPSIDVFLPSCGEPIEVLANTYWYVSRMKWPGELNVYILDDSGREEDKLKELASNYGFHYLSRENRGFLKKAGNLKFGYENSGGDFIAVFDADFVPREDYLHHLMPYFDDPTIGIVQSPQFFGTDSWMNWLERGAGATQELFYRWIQPSRDSLNAAICVGTCAVYRRQALDASGGFAQISHSEDVHTGFALMLQKYFVRYVPVNVSKGLCPDTLPAFISQQYRWCTGSMTLMKSKRFWSSPLNFKKKVAFSAGFSYYLGTALFSFVASLPAMLVLWGWPMFLQPITYIVVALPLLFSYGIFPLVIRATWDMGLPRVQTIYSFAHAVAIWDVFRRKSDAWAPTGDNSSSKKSPTPQRVKKLMVVWNLFRYFVIMSGIIKVLILGQIAFWLLVPLMLLLLLDLWILIPIFSRSI